MVAQVAVEPELVGIGKRDPSSGTRDSDYRRGELPPLRQPASPHGAARSRSAHRAQADRAADAGGWPARACAPAFSLYDRFRTRNGNKGNFLARRFAVAQPNFGWVADITYLWTLEGWLYLAIILDLFSRRVVGWSISERLEKKLAFDALSMALTERQPQGGLIHHSDRGSQYASYEYQQLLAKHDLVSSMSRKGNCWDSAVAESFFATLKIELAYQTRWNTRAQARNEVFEYIEIFYNHRRRHSALDYLCPDELERRQEKAMAA